MKSSKVLQAPCYQFSTDVKGIDTMTKYTPRPKITKACAVCATEFTAAHPKRKYCSIECQKVAFAAKGPEYQRRYGERHPERRKESARTYRESHLAQSREHNKEKMRQWREENPEESRSRAKEYYQRNAQKQREYQYKYRAQNPIRVKAQQFVNDTVRAGKLPHAKTQTCVRCGNPATEYHHWSYEEQDWLKVEAMCPTCHARADRERIAMEAK